MTPSRFEWPLPKAYSLAESDMEDRPAACMIAYADGRKSLSSITEFHPKQPDVALFSTTEEAPQTLSVNQVIWIRLLDDAHLKDADGDEILDWNWEQAKQDFSLEFKSGERMSGELIGHACSDTGWFLYQPKKTGVAIRYFVPHAAVGKLTVGENCLSELLGYLFKEKKNAKIAALFQKMPDKYPFALEQKYERILNKIADLWDTPEIEDYFSDLMVDRRGGRQGFPPEVANEIVVLSRLHEMLQKQVQETNDDPWGRDQAKDELSSLGIHFEPQHFMKALERGDENVAALFIKGGINLNFVGENGWTPLMVAAFNGNENMARLLIEKGANIHIQDNAGYAPLHWAAFNGFKDVTATLLRLGANPNISNRFGWTPLLQAAARGHAGIVQMLLARGAKPNQSDEEGWTPLHKATANGYLEVVKLLLDAGADIRAAHRNGATPMSLAKEKNRIEIIQLFHARMSGN